MATIVNQRVYTVTVFLRLQTPLRISPRADKLNFSLKYALLRVLLHLSYHVFNVLVVQLCAIKYMGTRYLNPGRFYPEKSRGVMAPGIRKRIGGLGASPPERAFARALFTLRKRPILAQRFATCTEKNCKNEGEQAK